VPSLATTWPNLPAMIRGAVTTVALKYLITSGLRMNTYMASTWQLTARSMNISETLVTKTYHVTYSDAFSFHSYSFSFMQTSH
jgi:hypothetical protein